MKLSFEGMDETDLVNGAGTAAVQGDRLLLEAALPDGQEIESLIEEIISVEQSVSS